MTSQYVLNAWFDKSQLKKVTDEFYHLKIQTSADKSFEDFGFQFSTREHAIAFVNFYHSHSGEQQPKAESNLLSAVSKSRSKSLLHTSASSKYLTTDSSLLSNPLRSPPTSPTSQDSDQETMFVSPRKFSPKKMISFRSALIHQVRGKFK